MSINPLISKIFKLIEEKNSLINLFERYEKQIEKRDSLIKVQKAMIEYLESELKKYHNIADADDIIRDELVKRKNSFKKEMELFEIQSLLNEESLEKKNLTQAKDYMYTGDPGYVMDEDKFARFCGTLSKEDAKIFRSRIQDGKSYREILRIPSVKIKSTSTIKARYEKLLEKYKEFLSKIPNTIKSLKTPSSRF
tara:strand:- start:840 stop:1424 length:585 start_codon:yes stop_codon:yes gene_type:complete